MMYLYMVLQNYCENWLTWSKNNAYPLSLRWTWFSVGEISFIKCRMKEMNNLRVEEGTSLIGSYVNDYFLFFLLNIRMSDIMN